ncbi:hypothetical protein Vadar_032792 [Vaccinium darrowii]|uniref:Uncharacterized protein n=1 Tax=Vaccinium darrowii TaxID=229202 RepID=A0ACB7ZPJ0_9ERIC|nr:hypothetical protein Vadar_032792 [Vaccinium darrowii]
MVRPAPCWGQSNPTWYQLALQWPNAYCDTHHCITPVPQRFTIHGVFGMDNQNRPTCCQDSINARGMNNAEKHYISYYLGNKLNQHWPNLANRHDNMAFWDSEFKKHASCFNIHPWDYFQNALALKRQLDRNINRGANLPRSRSWLVRWMANVDPTQAVLLQHGVQPGGVYYASQFATAFYPNQVQVKCHRPYPNLIRLKSLGLIQQVHHNLPEELDGHCLGDDSVYGGSA